MQKDENVNLNSTEKINSSLPYFCEARSYKIFLTIFVFKNKIYYHASVKINCKSSESSIENNLILNSVQENYRIINCKLLHKNKSYDLKCEPDKEFQESVRLTFDKTLNIDKNSDFSLLFNVVGQINEGKKALFFCRKEKLSNETLDFNNIVIANCFAPAEARFFIPCFDLPNYKSEFKILLNLSKEFNNTHTISNNQRVLSQEFVKYKEEKNFLKEFEEKSFFPSLVKYDPELFNHLNFPSNFLKDFTTHKFEKTPKMSIYLLNITIGAFLTKEYQTPTTLISVYYYKNDITAELILCKSAEALAFYEAYFNHRYIFPKLDIILLPDLDFSGMENWGSILFSYPTSAVNSPPSFSEVSYITQIVYHEVSHMWFGNLTTMSSFRDLWLNEGFASFMEYFAGKVDYDKSGLDYFEQFLGKRGLFALNSDNEDSRPMLVSDKEINPRNLDKIYDFVNYSKSSTIVFYLLSIVGEENFKKAIQIYLKKFELGNAKTEDLLDIFDDVSHKNVKISMLDFVSSPCYPFFVVKRDVNKREIIISQYDKSEFLLNFSEYGMQKKNEEIKEKPIFWHVYVSIFLIFKKELKKENFVVKIYFDVKMLNLTKFLKENYKIDYEKEIETIIFNFDKFSYCRVYYDKELFSKYCQISLNSRNFRSETSKFKKKHHFSEYGERF